MNFTIAATVDEALAALAAGARPIAGGSDLMVGHRQGKAPLPDTVVAIDRLGELALVHQDDLGLSIGALVSHHVIEHHSVIAQQYSALADASALVGSPSTRNVGTLGGNVMNASPAMDTGAPLVVLGAQVELRSTTASRRLLPSELWVGPGRTSAASDELCVAVHLPAPADDAGSAYVRLEYRRAMEIAVVGAASSVSLHPDGSVAAIRVALTAVAPTIVEVDGLDDLVGRPIDDALAGCCRPTRRRASPPDQRPARQRPLPPPLHRRHGSAQCSCCRHSCLRPAHRRACQSLGRHRSGLVTGHHVDIMLHVNGIAYPVTVDATRNLLSTIRTEVGLTGTKEGCDDCECGACMVLIDGQPVNSCSYLAAQADERAITTVEGVMTGDQLHPLQRNLLDEGGVQCGFCTPGMIISAAALLARNPSPTADEICIGLSGNLCRCTGYAKIIAAVERTAAEGRATNPKA